MAHVRGVQRGPASTVGAAPAIILFPMGVEVTGPEIVRARWGAPRRASSRQAAQVSRPRRGCVECFSVSGPIAGDD
jgi:hypothetical protein